MSSTILGDKSCENVYEEGVTYFGEQVSLFIFNSVLGNVKILDTTESPNTSDYN